MLIFREEFLHISDHRIWGVLVSMGTDYTPHYSRCNMISLSSQLETV